MTNLAVVEGGLSKAQLEQLQGSDLPLALIVCLGQQPLRKQRPEQTDKLIITTFKRHMSIIVVNNVTPETVWKLLQLTCSLHLKPTPSTTFGTSKKTKHKSSKTDPKSGVRSSLSGARQIMASSPMACIKAALLSHTARVAGERSRHLYSLMKSSLVPYTDTSMVMMSEFPSLNDPCTRPSSTGSGCQFRAACSPSQSSASAWSWSTWQRRGIPTESIAS